MLPKNSQTITLNMHLKTYNSIKLISKKNEIPFTLNSL